MVKSITESHFPQLVMLSLIWISSPAYPAPAECNYDSYQWSTIDKQAVNYTRVSHPYQDLGNDEIDAYTGCSVCEEDQIEIRLPGITPFKVCRVVAGNIESLLQDLIDAGEPIHTVIGYRVGKSRGDIDENGLRTRFSNHSYGIAIDINPQHNGLYDQCHDFNMDCRLIRGGEWRPKDDPLSLTPDGMTVYRMQQEGFKWGGSIRGKQKDFMHFSPTGY